MCLSRVSPITKSQPPLGPTFASATTGGAISSVTGRDGGGKHGAMVPTAYLRLPRGTRAQACFLSRYHREAVEFVI